MTAGVAAAGTFIGGSLAFFRPMCYNGSRKRKAVAGRNPPADPAVRLSALKGAIAVKTLIVYYSLEGNTDYAAKLIAENLSADLLCLVPEKAYPTGKVSKYIWGGKAAVMSEKPKLQPYEFDAAAYDRIVFGFPVWASNIAPPLRTFIRSHDLSGKKIAAFACQTASGAEKAFTKLKGELQTDVLEAELVLLDPKTKPNPENEQKIRAFCDRLK